MGTDIQFRTNPDGPQYFFTWPLLLTELCILFGGRDTSILDGTEGTTSQPSPFREISEILIGSNPIRKLEVLCPESRDLGLGGDDLNRHDRVVPAPSISTHTKQLYQPLASLLNGRTLSGTDSQIVENLTLHRHWASDVQFP